MFSSKSPVYTHSSLMALIFIFYFLKKSPAVEIIVDAQLLQRRGGAISHRNVFRRYIKRKLRSLPESDIHERRVWAYQSGRLLLLVVVVTTSALAHTSENWRTRQVLRIHDGQEGNGQRGTVTITLEASPAKKKRKNRHRRIIITRKLWWWCALISYRVTRPENKLFSFY